MSSALSSHEEGFVKLLTAFLTGLLFGIGLLVSGMANPAKVLGFLDLAGNWDPSLAFVMGGALLVGASTFHLIMVRSRSVLGEAMRLPVMHHIDRRLVGGSLAFGLGWGLVGFCPGPALTALFHGGVSTWLFAASMLAGMALFAGIERYRHPRRPAI